MAKPFLDGHRVYARDVSVKKVHGTDHCLYRPDGSRIPGMRWVLQTAAKSTRSEQVPRWQKLAAALKDPKQAVGVHTRLLHGRVAEPWQSQKTQSHLKMIICPCLCLCPGAVSGPVTVITLS